MTESSSRNQTIGKFRIVRELGRGAMGIVYEAFQDDLQRRVALKLITPRVLATKADAADSFEREARLAASARHPGIVTVHEVGVAEGRAYLAMEFVDGQSLADKLREDGPCDPRECASLVSEISRAVAALHGLGILHRDLKPDNVMIDADGRARVTDFGVALLRDEEAEESAGTPGFMAPEQLSRRYGPISERSDVYGLGAVLHAMLTGQQPHAASGSVEIVMATLERDVPPAAPAAGVPAELWAICRRCLERQPEQRYPSADALADDLERWLRGDAPEATPPGFWQRAQSFFRRRRMLSARLVALLALEALTIFDYYALAASTPSYFASINLVLGLLFVASIALDWLNRSGVLERSTRYIWPALDCAGLTWLLLEGEGVRSSLVILYPLLIVTTGFWLDRSVVIATSAMTTVCYGLLALFAGSGQQIGADEHLSVFTALLVTGVIMTLQVMRGRALREYASQRTRSRTSRQ